MAISREVKCISKMHTPHRHERITHIGGDWGFNGTRVKITQAEAVEDIDNGIYSYFVRSGTDIAKVIVYSHLGNRYLKTEADSTTKDNLLSLPECK